MLFLLESNEVTRPLARQRVTIVDYPDGRIAIRHKARDLPYRTFDKLQKVNQAAIVENKRLGEILAYIAARQDQGIEGRSKKARADKAKLNATRLRPADDRKEALARESRIREHWIWARGRCACWGCAPARPRVREPVRSAVSTLARKAPFLHCTDRQI